jgi:crotonobetainyl-CoA:carnitine CoA-transferase CaiB-like acyl-CoA transferase
VTGTGPAAHHASALLAALGASPASNGDRPDVTVPLDDAPDALTDWAASGAMALTGRPTGPPLAARGSPASLVRAALAVFAALSEDHSGSTAPATEASLLGERAALAGHRRNGPWSCGGASRVLPARDGWIVVSLPRKDDLTLVPALVESGTVRDPWSAVSAWAATVAAHEAAARAQLLGIAAAVVPASPAAADEQARHRERLAGANNTTVLADAGGRRTNRGRPLVVDLTSLWAGPLCARLLSLAGAEVIKVEGTSRPDGARGGPPEFYTALHAGHACVALDLGTSRGVELLRRLVDSADVVLEASRPRALRQLGVDAAQAVADGTIWTSITAYGRSGPWSNRVGFGDDVAASAGLVLPDSPDLLFCGDAIADPMTGAVAAAATMAALLSGRAHLLDVSMRDVVAATVHGTVPAPEVSRGDDGRWWIDHEGGRVPVHEPRSRRTRGRAHDLGEDTARVIERLGPA